MTILSLDFLQFVLLTLVIYYLLPGRLQNLFLLLASYYFYSTWNHYYPLLLFGSSLLVFGWGHWLHRAQRGRRIILGLGILLNVGLMLWYLIGGKALYQALSPEQRVDLFPLLLLPVGLSYYVLNSISYLIDIHLRLAKPTHNLIDFALYLAWYPKLISGPLERARRFLPQLSEKRIVDDRTIASSLTLILIGLFRAAILAGALALYLPAAPLLSPADYGNPILIWALVTYAFYLYNQFAGYTDIVRGVSSLFGIQLSRNFNAPFFSKDVSDFWQRWHISLSQWLRDYIYLPLSRAFLRRNPSRTNIPNLLVPPMVTMLISGLWHGADGNHLLWGALMGLLIVLENLRALRRPVVASAVIPLSRQLIERLWLILLMSMATVPFVVDLKLTRIFFIKLIRGWDGQMFDLRPIWVLALSLLLDWFQHRHSDELVFQTWPSWARTILLAIIPLGVIVVTHLQSAPPVFVYP